MEVKNQEAAIKPETVIDILEKHGEIISMEDAKTIAKLIQYFAGIAVNQLIKAD